MTDIKRAMQNGGAWYATIQELVIKLRQIQDGEIEGDEEDVRREIEEGPLSIQVRGGWRSPGESDLTGAEEYEILLSTGGPALRIYGRLGQYNEPETAELQAQDWFTPWTIVEDCDEDILLTYARSFYYGEG
jgi:hypothetical protein